MRKVGIYRKYRGGLLQQTFGAFGSNAIKGACHRLPFLYC